MMATRVNYDILAYLPDEVETVQGENILQNEFNMGSYSIIVTENMSTKDIQKLENKFKELENVEKSSKCSRLAWSKCSSRNVTRRSKRHCI